MDAKDGWENIPENENGKKNNNDTMVKYVLLCCIKLFLGKNKLKVLNTKKSMLLTTL